MDLRFWLLLQLIFLCVASDNLGFNVHKGGDRSLTDFKAHDARRHGRSLSVVDIPMRGNSASSPIGLYFTRIGLGSPPKDYYVQIDTGSNILWVNGVSCKNCPTSTKHGKELTLYDAKRSSSSEMITCDHGFCTAAINHPTSHCNSGFSCPFSVQFRDGSNTAGYFVKDNIVLDQVSGDHQTSSIHEPVIFGSGAGRSGGLYPSGDPLDGILGLGQANTSIISQLADAGKVKRMFAHCLDTKVGGGIFTIGEVVKPAVTKIPMVPNRTHYHLVLKKIEVGGEALQISPDTFDAGHSLEARLDIGTNLAYFPDDIYVPLMDKIASQASIMRSRPIKDSPTCFYYSGGISSVFKEFPTVKLHFQKSLTLTIQPSEYLSPQDDATMCVGWETTWFKSDEKPMILLGDMVLANKLVVYDLEDQAIGWTDYDCSSSTTRVKDENGSVYTVNAHNTLSAAGQVQGGTRARTSLLMFMWICVLIKFFGFVY